MLSSIFEGAIGAAVYSIFGKGLKQNMAKLFKTGGGEGGTADKQLLKEIVINTQITASSLSDLQSSFKEIDLLVNTTTDAYASTLVIEETLQDILATLQTLDFKQPLSAASAQFVDGLSEIQEQLRTMNLEQQHARAAQTKDAVRASMYQQQQSKSDKQRASTERDNSSKLFDWFDDTVKVSSSLLKSVETTASKENKIFKSMDTSLLQENTTVSQYAELTSKLYEEIQDFNSGEAVFSQRRTAAMFDMVKKQSAMFAKIQDLLATDKEFNKKFSNKGLFSLDYQKYLRDQLNQKNLTWDKTKKLIDKYTTKEFQHGVIGQAARMAGLGPVYDMLKEFTGDFQGFKKEDREVSKSLVDEIKKDKAELPPAFAPTKPTGTPPPASPVIVPPRQPGQPTPPPVKTQPAKPQQSTAPIPQTEVTPTKVEIVKSMETVPTEPVSIAEAAAEAVAQSIADELKEQNVQLATQLETVVKDIKKALHTDDAETAKVVGRIDEILKAPVVAAKDKVQPEMPQDTWEALSGVAVSVQETKAMTAEIFAEDQKNTLMDTADATDANLDSIAIATESSAATLKDMLEFYKNEFLDMFQHLQDKAEGGGVLAKIEKAVVDNVKRVLAATLGALGLKKVASKLGVKTGEKVLEKGGEKVVEKTGEKVLEKGGEKVVEKTGEKVLEKGGEKVVEKVTAKTGEKLTAEVTEKSTEKVLEKITEKGGEKTTEKILEKATAEITAKVAGKSVAKSLAKKIPLLGALAGVYFAYERLKEGDLKGASLEMASGVAGASSVVTGPLGTAISAGIDLGLAGGDIAKIGKAEKQAQTSGTEIQQVSEVPVLSKALSDLRDTVAVPDSDKATGLAGAAGGGLGTMLKEMNAHLKSIEDLLKKQPTVKDLPEDPVLNLTIPALKKNARKDFDLATSNFHK
jgi:hypothetical protein